MKRLFTFGCSFTNYHWPTWADILGLEYDHYENWGKGSSSNHFILYSLNEMLARNSITASDTIIVMLTGPNRQFTFKDASWIHTVHRKFTTNSILDNITLDMNIISTIISLLKNVKCKVHILSIINYTDKNHTYINSEVKKSNTLKNLNSIYNTTNFINRSVFDLIFNFNWYSRNDVMLKKTDIVPLIAIDKFDESDIHYLRQDYENVKGGGWPSLDSALNNDFDNTDPEIVDEIMILFKKQFDIINGITFKRINVHPSPAEQLEYITKLDLFDITQKQIDQTEIWNYQLLNGVVNDSYTSHRTPFKRIGYS